MRFLILLTVLGLVSANIIYTPGKEYVFKYNGKVLTGVPDIDAHFAGLAIACDVIVQAVDVTTFKMMLKNVMFTKFDQRLEGPMPYNWRTMMTPTPVAAPVHLLPFLESPVVFNMVQGKITVLKMSALEPEWTVNIKKALVSQLKIQFPIVGSSSPVVDNQIEQSATVLPNFFQVMEPAVDGVCMNTYTVTELPLEFVKDPVNGFLPLVKPELCTGKKFFEIIRFRDVTKCEKINVYVAGHIVQKETIPKHSMTKFVGCGVDRGHVEVHGVVNEAEFIHDIVSYHTEPMVTGTMMVLKLFAIKDVMTVVPEIVQPRIMHHIFYEWPVMSGSVAEHTMAPFFVRGTDAPTTTVRTPAMVAKHPELGIEHMKTHIFTMLTEIATGLTEVQHIEDKHVTTKLMNVAHYFSMLTFEEMKVVFTMIQTADIDAVVKKTIVDLTIDVTAMTGTHHAVLFLKHLVETHPVHTIKVLTTITTLAHYIRTPTVEMLNNIFAIIKAPIVLNNKVIKHNALLNFANILNKACFAPTKVHRFPEHIFGEFCNAATSEIATVYIPYIMEQLRTTEDPHYKETIIMALGAIGHESIIPLLLPHIQGKVAGCTTSMRLMAMFSLEHVAEKHAAILLPIFTGLWANPAEHRHVRMTALTMLLKMKPTFAFMQRLAIFTWYEKDVEMAKFVYSTIWSLTELKTHVLEASPHLLHLKTMAKIVLPMAKPIPGILFSTSNLFAAEYLAELNRGFESQTLFTMTPMSKIVFQKLVTIIHDVKIPALKMLFALEGEKSFYDQIFQTVLEAVNGQSSGANPLDSVHAEWRQIVQDMNIQARTGVPFKTTFFTQAFDDMVTMFGFGQGYMESLKTEMKSYLRNPRSMLQSFCGVKPFNINQAFNLMPTEMVFPTELGLPVIVVVHQPHVLSFQGELNIDCTNFIPTFELTLKTKFLSNAHAHVSTICPFTNEMVMAGIDKLKIINKPIKTIVKIDPITGKLGVNILPVVTPAVTQVDFFHYHVKPFTCIRSLFDFTPFTLLPTFKIIHMKKEPLTWTKKFGQPLGLDLTFNVATEGALIDTKMVFDKLHMYNFNIFNMIVFPFTWGMTHINGMPCNRYARFTVMYNPVVSTTKEFEFEMKFALASLVQSEQPMQHVFRSSESQSTPTIEAQSVPVTDSKLQTMLAKVGGEKTFAVNTYFKIILKGAATKLFNMGFTVGVGGNMIHQKWSIVMDEIATTDGMFNFCVDGHIIMPTLPIWSTESILAMPVKFDFFNKIGFGTTCEQYTIDMVGKAAVSEAQKAFSKVSEEALLCQSSDVRPMIPSALSRHDACHRQRDQAATLDQYEFTITHTGLPATWIKHITGFQKVLQVFLWKYAATCPFESAMPTQLAKIKFQFNTKIHTLHMTLITPTETLLWKHIRLPEKLWVIVPIVAGKEPFAQVHEVFTGSSFRPTCHMFEDRIQTFDKLMYSYQMDDCFHVVASDCSRKFSSSVLAKMVGGMKHVKVFHKTTEIQMIPVSSGPMVFRILVDGQEIPLSRDQMKTVFSSDGRRSFKLFRSVDDVLTMEIPDMIIQFNGVRLEVQSRRGMSTGQFCGLCGSGSSVSSLRAPSSCRYSSNDLVALAYRRQTDQCSVLPRAKLDLLAAEESSCAQARVEKARRMSQLPQPQMSTGIQMKHSVIKKEGRVCISQVPISSCLSDFEAASNIQKTISFTCLPASNKVARLYVDKVMRGEILRELRSMDTHYWLPTQMPVFCIRSSSRMP